MITQILMSKGIMSKDKLLETWDSDKKCKFIFIFAVIRFLLINNNFFCIIYIINLSYKIYLRNL